MRAAQHLSDTAYQAQQQHNQKNAAATLPSFSGSGAVMSSAASDATMGRQLAGVAIVTRPAPERSAAIPARNAAPVLPTDPATTVTRPKSPLCESAVLGSISSRSCSGVSRSTCGPSSPSMTS